MYILYHVYLYIRPVFLWEFAFPASNRDDPLYGTVQDPKKLLKLTEYFVYLFEYFQEPFFSMFLTIF